MTDTPTSEETARYYSAMMDSVNLINALVPTTDADALGILDRNVRHLEMVSANNWWDGYDLAPIHAAIAAAKQ
jgi:hypothetical protein